MHQRGGVTSRPIALSVLLTRDFAEVYGAKLAARLTIMFSDVLLRAVAEAEADTSTTLAAARKDAVVKNFSTEEKSGVSKALNGSPATDVMLTIAHVVRDDRESVGRGHLATYIARDRADAADVADYTVERIVSVNVSRAISRVRVGAEERGIDLSDPFMPVANTTEYNNVMQPYTEMPGGIVEVGAFRKREIASRRAGERARLIAMGGTNHGTRGRVTDMTATAAI